MDITQPISMLFSLIRNFISLLDSDITFNMFGYRTSLLGIIFAFILISIIISVFWKGARG